MKDNKLKINGDRIAGIQSIEWNANLCDGTCWAMIEFKNIPIEAGGVRRYEYLTEVA